MGIYEQTALDPEGKQVQLSEYKGNVLLIVNVASECGFTKQYTGLEALNKKYAAKGLRILGFPSNDYGGQEPGTIKEIQEFCSINYGVSFDLFDKIKIKGETKHPLYKWLLSQAADADEVKWNFEKFLISADGKLLGHFESAVTPEELEKEIEQALT